MEWVNTAPGHALIGSSCARTEVDAFSWPQFSKTWEQNKRLCVYQTRGSITRARHERIHLLFSKPPNLRPVIKIEKRGKTKIIIIPFIYFNVLTGLKNYNRSKWNKSPQCSNCAQATDMTAHS